MMNNKTFEEKYQGKQFGSLVILGKDPKDKSGHVLYVVAACLACGNRKKMLISNIIYGMSKTCGCGQRLAVAKARRNAFKIVVETPKGPKSLRSISEDYNEPYAKIYARFRSGRTTLDELVNMKRKKSVKKADPRLSGLSQAEAARLFGILPQVVSFRLKKGWTINAKGSWVSPTKGEVGTKVFRMSKTAKKKLLKRKYLEKFYA